MSSLEIFALTKSILDHAADHYAGTRPPDDVTRTTLRALPVCLPRLHSCTWAKLTRPPSAATGLRCTVTWDVAERVGWMGAPRSGARAGEH